MVAVASVFVALPGIDPPAAHAELPELGHCSSDAEMQVGASGPSVICLQWNLLWMGDFKGQLTGKFDQATADAVIRFQQHNPPLFMTGVATAETLTVLGNYSGVNKVQPLPCLADAPVKAGDRSPSAECVQQTLAQLTLYSGKVTGTFDAATTAAVKAFQVAHPPLAATGLANTTTLAAMGIWSGFTVQSGTAAQLNWFPAGLQAEPNWHVVAGIPVYGNRHPCARADADTIAREFAKDGADVNTQQYFIYVASREGNCNYQATNINPATHDDSHCTFQLNALSGMFEPNGQLGRRGWTKDNVEASMQACADAASDLWVFCDRGPWTPPTYGCKPPWTGDLGPNGD
jgi:peptidoglycan hydrolase-like protein with peptidoglycan-binding domain